VPLDAKGVPLAFIGCSGATIGDNTVRTLDIYYCIDKPNDQSAFVFVWGDGDRQRAMLPVAQICEVLATHCKSIEMPQASLAAHSLAVLLDCANSSNGSVFAILATAVAVQMAHSEKHFSNPNDRSTSFPI